LHLELVQVREDGQRSSRATYRQLGLADGGRSYLPKQIKSASRRPIEAAVIGEEGMAVRPPIGGVGLLRG